MKDIDFRWKDEGQELFAGFEFRWREIDQSNRVPWTCTPIRFHQIVRHHPSRAVSRGFLLLRVQMSADSKVTSIDRHSPARGHCLFDNHSFRFHESIERENSFSRFFDPTQFDSWKPCFEFLKKCVKIIFFRFSPLRKSTATFAQLLIVSSLIKLLDSNRNLAKRDLLIFTSFPFRGKFNYLFEHFSLSRNCKRKQATIYFISPRDRTVYRFCHFLDQSSRRNIYEYSTNAFHISSNA